MKFSTFERFYLPEHDAHGENLILPPFSSKFPKSAEYVRLKGVEKALVSLRNGL